MKIFKRIRGRWRKMKEVVRCKDCIYRRNALSTAEGASGCILIQGVFYDDFYCAAGIFNEDGDFNDI